MTELTAPILEAYFDRLWPICRSITGNGVRDSLRILQELMPLHIHEVPTGTKVLDWTVPNEWNIRAAYIERQDGTRIADFSENNLHIVNYSTPFQGEVSYEELRNHVHTIPHMPKAVPYITSYYKERWGFCMSQETWDSLSPDERFRVVVDSELKPGSLTYADMVLPGETSDEIFFSTYICHPSMANNELSGPLAAAALYQKLAAMPRRRYTYRFVFVPETIGAICYLQQYGDHLKEAMKAGFVLTCCGDDGAFHYKRSRALNTLVNKVTEHHLRFKHTDAVVQPFRPDGSDERQYCSPGFNLPVGSLMRTPYYQYAQYHTSDDNKSFISFEALIGTAEAYFELCQLLEWNLCYTNLFPYGEPQLGKRGLYPEVLGPGDRRDYVDSLLFLLNYSDGAHDLLDIAELRGVHASQLIPIVQKCLEAHVLSIQ